MMLDGGDGEVSVKAGGISLATVGSNEKIRFHSVAQGSKGLPLVAKALEPS